MAQKNKSDIIYALADYKQLVVAYKTKYAQMVRQVTFWKTCFIWLGLAVIALCVAIVVGYLDYTHRLAASVRDIEMLQAQVKGLSHQLDDRERQLHQARLELEQRQEAVTQFEKNVSTTSKKLLEKLLKD